MRVAISVRLQAFLIAFVCCAAPALAAGWSAKCGQLNQAPCAWSEAKLAGKQGGLCAAGQFFDLIQGGTCWTCPQGHGRTVFAVDTDKACEKVAAQDFRRAVERGKGRGFFGTDCDAGQFWDIVDGNCHSCPDGYAMQVLEHVHGARKCAKGIPAAFAKATRIGPPCGAGKLWDPRNGGECWSCPDDFVRTVAPVTAQVACEYKGLLGGTGLIGCGSGLSSIRGTCRKTGECGKQGQRPCEVGERIPSCDAGMKEDFKQNLCVALRAGETPFTGGLSSLSGYLGAALQAHCKSILGSVKIDAGGNLGLGLTCGKDATVGFTCALLRDVVGGYPDLLNGLMEKVPAGASLADQMNAAAAASPCKELGERFAKAEKHGKATGKVLQIECPAGQFWDPDGNCYSCPKDYTRTLFPVTDARSCTDKVGGNLARFGCGAYKGIEANFNAPLKCTVEVLENGSLFERPVDLSKANELVCTATGELGYYVVRTGIEAGKAAFTGDISGILTTIGKVKSSAANAFELNRLMECRKQK
jgi:hypothetical protein